MGAEEYQKYWIEQSRTLTAKSTRGKFLFARRGLALPVFGGTGTYSGRYPLRSPRGACGDIGGTKEQTLISEVAHERYADRGRAAGGRTDGFPTLLARRLIATHLTPSRAWRLHRAHDANWLATGIKQARRLEGHPRAGRIKASGRDRLKLAKATQCLGPLNVYRFMPGETVRSRSPPTRSCV